MEVLLQDMPLRQTIGVLFLRLRLRLRPPPPAPAPFLVASLAGEREARRAFLPLVPEPASKDPSPSTATDFPASLLPVRPARPSDFRARATALAAGGGSREEENMRDPFNAPVDLIDTDRRIGNELTRTARDYVLQNGDAKPFVPSSDTLVRQSASLHNDLIAEDPNTRLMDPETKELYLRSRTQEEEILLLRKQITDASSKELQLLSEKHILERKLADLRMAVDERQEDAISGALKQLNEKRNHIEENMRLSNDLKVWCYCTFQECSRRRVILVHFFIAWHVSRTQCSPTSNICFNHYNCYKAFIPTYAMEDQIFKFWVIQLNLEIYIIPIINKQLRRETNLPHLTIWSQIGTLSPSMLKIQMIDMLNKCTMDPLLIRI
ncbi:hypothetical protein ACQ4PT_058749 [Festuca glaucescens]